MKILLTTDWYQPIINGVITSIVNLKKELEERGHEVRILTLSRTYHSYQEQNIYYLKSINLERIYPNVRGVLPQREGLIRELICWKPDIVHSHCEFMTFPYAVKISKKCGCPLIHTYHTVYEDYLHYIPGNLSSFGIGAGLEKKLVERFSRQVLKKTQHVIAPTEKVEKLLETYHVKAPISVIPTGVDLRKFRNRLSETEKNRKKEELGILSKSRVVVSVGRLAKEKNIEELIRYFGCYRKETGMKDLVLLLVGDGPDKERLEAVTKSLHLEQQVLFTGMIRPDEIGNYYQLGEIFLCASTSETQGITYLEALASGIPVLCKKDDCLKHVITDGYNGFQYDNYEYFKMHLDYMLKNKKERIQMGEQARKSSELYSIWNFGTMAERLYNEELGGRNHEKNQYVIEGRYGKRTRRIVCSR